MRYVPTARIADGQNLLRRACRDTGFEIAPWRDCQKQVSVAVAARSTTAESVGLQSDLAQGVTRHEFVPYFQPIVDTQTGRVIGLEVLTRWKHPVHGLLPANSFIDLAEETGLIADISACTIPEALAWLAQWRAEHPSLVLNLNLSSVELRQGLWPSLLPELLDQLGIPPNAVRLEITERMRVDGHKAVAMISQFVEAGIRIALDDFGTGYSSLTYLQQLPADNVKMDRSFVANIGADAAATTIVRAVTDLCHSLGMTVTAEGVESAAQFACLKEIGCDEAQGYFLAQPMPPEQISLMLHSPQSLGGQ